MEKHRKDHIYERVQSDFEDHELPAASCHEIICVCLRKHTVTRSSDKAYKLWRTMNDLSETSIDKEINYLISI